MTNKTNGIQLSPPSGDSDATGHVPFETSTGKVVTSTSRSTTAPSREPEVCTAFGSVIGT
jgi:hypothetical protein